MNTNDAIELISTKIKGLLVYIENQQEFDDHDELVKYQVYIFSVLNEINKIINQT